MAEKQGVPSDDHSSQPLQQSANIPSQVPMNAWQPFQQTPWPAQPQQPIVIQVVQARRGPTIRENYRSRLSHALGITQIGAALFGILLNSIGWWLQVGRSFRRHYDYDHGPGSSWGRYYWYPSEGYFSAVGIWGAVFFILSGAFAISAAKRRTTCLIVTHMVMSILAAFFAVFMFGFSAWAVGVDADRLQEGFSYTKYFNSPENHTPQYDFYDYNNTYPKPTAYYRKYHKPEETIEYDAEQASRGKASLALSVFMLLVSIVELVACVWSSTLTCRVCCCAPATEERVTPGVQYMAAPQGSQQQPQVIFLGAPYNTQAVAGVQPSNQGLQGQPPIQPGTAPTVQQSSQGDVTPPPPYQ